MSTSAGPTAGRVMDLTFAWILVASVRRTLAWPWPVGAAVLMAGVVMLAVWLASR